MMKKYYLKQKVFSFTDKYKVFDENQNVIFHCEGRFMSFSHRMDFFATVENRHLFTIKRQIFSFLPVYHLTDPNGKEVATVRKRFTFLKQKLDIESDFGAYTIEGDFLSHLFSIQAGGTPVVDFQKKWLSWGDSYEISIYAEQNIDFLVALVVMIDDCLHDNEGRRSGVSIGFGSHR
jgi:uncharacterized protein YxjI